MIAVMQAAVDGKKIECQDIATKSGWYPANKKCWNWAIFDYRIAPESRRVPLTADDIPPICWLRRPNDTILNNACYLVTAVHNDRVRIALNTTTYTLEELQKGDAQYSADRKTWKPCYKEILE